MRKKKKTKAQERRAPYLYIRLYEMELEALYGPDQKIDESITTVDEALAVFHADMDDIAKHNGYNMSDIFLPAMQENEDYIRELWRKKDNEGNVDAEDPDESGWLYDDLYIKESGSGGASE